VKQPIPQIACSPQKQALLFREIGFVGTFFTNPDKRLVSEPSERDALTFHCTDNIADAPLESNPQQYEPSLLIPDGVFTRAKLDPKVPIVRE